MQNATRHADDCHFSALACHAKVCAGWARQCCAGRAGPRGRARCRQCEALLAHFRATRRNGGYQTHGAPPASRSQILRASVPLAWLLFTGPRSSTRCAIQWGWIKKVVTTGPSKWYPCSRCQLTYCHRRLSMAPTGRMDPMFPTRILVGACYAPEVPEMQRAATQYGMRVHA